MKCSVVTSTKLEDGIQLIRELKTLKGAMDYDGDCSFQVLFELRNGTNLRLGVTEDSAGFMWADIINSLFAKYLQQPVVELKEVNMKFTIEFSVSEEEGDRAVHLLETTVSCGDHMHVTKSGMANGNLGRIEHKTIAFMNNSNVIDVVPEEPKKDELPPVGSNIDILIGENDKRED